MFASIVEDSGKKLYYYINKINNHINVDCYSYTNSGVNRYSKDIFNVFSFLKLSNNNKYIGEYNNYKLYKDIDTGYVHYIKNGIEDYKMFYINNGDVALLYDDISEPKLLVPKKFSNGVVSVVFASFMVMFFMIQAIEITNRKDITVNNNVSEEEIVANTNTISKEDIYNVLYSSNKLSETEKNYLYNEKFLDKMLPYVYSSMSLNYQLINHYQDLEIKSFNDDSNTLGYYNPFEVNTIYIKNYQKNKFSSYRDTIAHEFIHLNQASYDYQFINECSAEIISYEYFNGTVMSGYDKGVVELKILMEIIGPELIWKYNFSGDFTGIKDIFDSYLNKNDVNTLLSYLKTTPSKITNYDKFNELLDKLYNKMYNSKMSDDDVISLLLGNESFDRYYFNEELFKDQTITINSNNYMTLSIKDASSKDLISFYKYNKIDVSNIEDIPMDKQVLSNYELGNCKIEKDGNVSILDGNDKRLLSVRDALSEGLIKVKYYYMDDTLIDYNEYMSNKDNPNYYIKSNNNYKYVVNGDNINIYVSYKTIKSIDSKFDMGINMSK